MAYPASSVTGASTHVKNLIKSFDVTTGNLIWLDLIGFATALVGSCSQFQGSHKFTQSFDIFLCYSVTFHVPQFYIQL